MITNLKNILLTTILLSIGAFTILMFTKVIPYLSFEPAINFLGTKTDQVLEKPIFQWSFYIHIISSWFVMVAGIIQFIPYILKNYPAIHRTSGKIYVLLVLFLAAPSGFGLAFYANGGLSTKVGFTLQCIVWWFVTFFAWQEIRNKNWLLHTQSMIRSYAVTLAAMSLRLLSYIMIYNFGTKPIETYLTVTWLSWVGNLFIAEILIRYGFAQYHSNKNSMKNIIVSIGILLVLSITYYSCSRNSQDKTNVAAKLTTHKEAIDSLRIDNATEKPLLFTKLTKAQTNDSLSVLDLSKLFATTNLEEGFSNRFDGLYGKDNYRIEIYFAEATKDNQTPNTYHIKGKSRFKKTITPFEGTIIVDSLVAFEDPNIDTLNYDQESIKHKVLYSTVGKFILKEDSTAKGSGIFSGKITMDFLVRDDNSIDLWYFSPQTQSKASGFRFIGNWQSYQTKAIKPVIWAKDLFSFANEIIKDFSIGERDIEINPKYRHLGWDNYWEMDEWWHEIKPAQ